MFDLTNFLKARELLRAQTHRISEEMKPARVIQRGAPPDRQMLDMMLSSIQVTMNAVRALMDEYIALSAPELLQPRTDGKLICVMCKALVLPAEKDTHVCGEPTPPPKEPTRQ